MASSTAVSQEDAEILALRALTYLAGETERLSTFLSLTGLAPDDLLERAGDREVQVAVLGHLMGHESELLVFASSARVPPDHIALAYHRLTPSSA